MEKDIEILKSLIEDLKREEKLIGYNAEVEIQALENLIEGYRKLEEENKELKAKHYFITGLRAGKTLMVKNLERAREFEILTKMVDEMARMLVEVPCSPSDDPMTAVAKAMMNRDLELHKKQVINYVRNKVEMEENNE